MNIKECIKWTTPDGGVFDTKKEAEVHYENLELQESIRSSLYLRDTSEIEIIEWIKDNRQAVMSFLGKLGD